MPTEGQSAKVLHSLSFQIRESVLIMIVIKFFLLKFFTPVVGINKYHLLAILITLQDFHLNYRKDKINRIQESLYGFCITGKRS